jgi:hypothetical protein
VDIPHSLGAPEARRRIERGFVQLAEQMSASTVGHIDHAWSDNRMTFSFGALGQVITGAVSVLDDIVRVDAQLLDC